MSDRDLHVSVRIKRGDLLHAMQEAELSVMDLHRESGVSIKSIYDLLNFKVTPKNKLGAWRKTVIAISRALSYEPSQLFPEHLDIEVVTNRIESYVEATQFAMEGAEGPAELTARREAYDSLESVMERCLNEREKTVLNRRFFAGATLEEVGHEFRVNTERIRQIEAKALRKLRHPRHSLLPCWEME
jgi:RNA polymerase sigma factor (sigma-70 family)